MKKYEIALSEDGTIARCRLVSESEFAELTKSSAKIHLNRKEEKLSIFRYIESLQKQIDDLKKEIKVLKGEDDDEKE